LTDDSEQSAEKTNKKAVLWQGNRMYDAVVKLDKLIYVSKVTAASRGSPCNSFLVSISCPISR